MFKLNLNFVKFHHIINRITSSPFFILVATSKTNGIVARANRAIKNNTIKKNEYNNKNELQNKLIKGLKALSF